jgi:hypothetical protein
LVLKKVIGFIGSVRVGEKQSKKKAKRQSSFATFLNCRKMVLLERHRYMINRLADAFGQDENMIEKMMLQPEALNAINEFFSAAGPSKILITIEEVEIVDDAESVANSQSSAGGKGGDSDNENE